MSTLSTLKSAAYSKLATVHADVQAYVKGLEASVNANKLLVIGVGVAGLIIGGAVGHLV